MLTPVKTLVPDFTLRFTTVEDVPEILAFIKALATYEKMLPEVVATEAILRESLFGEHRTAEVVFACLEGKPVGFALFFHNFSTFLGRSGIYLEDLYIDPACRGKGFGKILMAFLANLAKSRGCGRFEWSVLDWNTPSINFYHSLGAIPMDGWTVFRATGDALDALSKQFTTP